MKITSLYSLRCALADCAELSKEQCDELRNYLDQSVQHSWEIDDVRTAIRDSDDQYDVYDLTDEHCMDILTRFEKYTDSEYGMTWEGLAYHIDEYCKENNIVKHEETDDGD